MSNHARLLNAVRAQAQHAGQQRITKMWGIVSSYDPVNYCAKVLLQPSGIETGWLPVASQWVGAGWGMFAPPSIGEWVDVHFQEDDIDAGYISLRLFHDAARPLNVQPGEFWLVHQSGSLLQFKNDGSVALQAAGNLTASAPNGTLRLAGKNVQIHASLSYSWDCGGYGEKWTANGSPNWTHQTWQIGATITPNAGNINPPEGP